MTYIRLKKIIYLYYNINVKFVIFSFVIISRRFNCCVKDYKNKKKKVGLNGRVGSITWRLCSTQVPILYVFYPHHNIVAVGLLKI